jgi:hypothetical protein
MKNLLDLCNELFDVLDTLGIDVAQVLEGDQNALETLSSIPLAAAYQQHYPLASDVSHFQLLGDEDAVCWLVINDGESHLGSYAPRDCFYR